MNINTSNCVIRINTLPIWLISGLSTEHLDTLYLRSWETLLKILPQHIPVGPAVQVFDIAATKVANLAKWRALNCSGLL